MEAAKNSVTGGGGKRWSPLDASSSAGGDSPLKKSDKGTGSLSKERINQMKSEVNAKKATMAAKGRAKYGGRFGEGNRSTNAKGEYTK